MFKENFIKLCNKRNESPSFVCRKVGITPATFSGWTESSVPRQATLHRIAEYFDVSVDSLIGREPKAEDARVFIAYRTDRSTLGRSKTIQKYIKKAGSDAVVKAAKGTEVIAGVTPEHFDAKYSAKIFRLKNSSAAPKTKKIPVYGNVVAGIPTEAITDIEDYEDIPAEWQGEYAALKIKGDSMSPRILEGDVVIIRVQDTVENGEIAVVIIDGESTCKRVQRTPDGISLISINPAYSPIFYSNKQIDELQLRIFGKVVELRGKF